MASLLRGNPFLLACDSISWKKCEKINKDFQLGGKHKGCDNIVEANQPVIVRMWLDIVEESVKKIEYHF